MCNGKHTSSSIHLINVDLRLGGCLEESRVPLTREALSLVLAYDTLVLQVTLVANQDHRHLSHTFNVSISISEIHVTVNGKPLTPPF